MVSATVVRARPATHGTAAGGGLLDRRAAQATEGEELADPAALDLAAVGREGADRHAGGEDAALHSPGEETAEEGIGFDEDGEQLGRLAASRLGRGRRGVGDDHLEQGACGRSGDRPARRSPSLRLPLAYTCGKSSCSSALLERGEENEHLAQHLVRLGVGRRPRRHHDRAQAEFERLAEDELGLRHHPFLGVDQQQGRIDHAEDPLDLAAEIGVARGVDDVDPRLAGGAAPQNRGRLGQDGDAALALLVVGIHRPLEVRLVGAEHPRLRQQLIDQGRLAVIDVSDDGDVAQCHGGQVRGGKGGF